MWAWMGEHRSPGGPGKGVDTAAPSVRWRGDVGLGG